MKRLGIFVFYDKAGIVDDYVVYLLQKMEGYLDHLTIVCNGQVTGEGKKRLMKFSSDIHIRENTGYDAMAYKLALTDYLGWDAVLRYEEVLLFNDTFFGPVYPLSELFSKMDARQCDFWGLTYHARAYDYFYGTNDILPAHVHTYFSAYRRPVLESRAFQDYWDQFDATEWFFSDVVRHEQFFTKYLEDAGFHWSTYIDAAEYNSKEPGSNFNHYYYIAYELVSRYRCPFIKRKNFVIKNMSMQAGNMGEDTANALHFIGSETGYDTNMIWGNILRLYNVAEIKNALHLDYIIPWEDAQGCSGLPHTLFRTTAVAAHLYYEELLASCIQYLKQVPEDIYLCVTTSKKTVKDEVAGVFHAMGRRNFEVRLVPNRGRDMGALLVGCVDLFRDFEYVCFVHDKKTKASVGPATVGKSFFYNLWENTLKSRTYIAQILTLFDREPRLGFLTVPPPIHAEFFGSVGLEWHNDFDNTVQLAEKLGLKANFSPDIPCFALGNAFWCRADALAPLAGYGFGYGDLPNEPLPLDGALNHALERIYPYVAQSQGYYSGCVMNTGYASLQNTNLYYFLSGVLSKIRAQQMVTDYPSVFESDILSYCMGKQNVLIYGAGTNGIKTSNILSQNGIPAKGFVVSDDQPKQQEKNGYPVYRLSDIPFGREEVGIVVSVAYTRDRREILSNLRQKGFQDYYLA